MILRPGPRVARNTHALMPTVNNYSEPGAKEVLILSSFFYLLNISCVTFECLIHAGLIGELLIGIVYGAPITGLIEPAWESAFRSIGYLGLILIVFEGGLFTQLDLLQENAVLSCLVATTGIVFPIGLSFLVLHLGFRYTLLESFCGGAALAATSLGTTFAILSSSPKGSSISDSVNTSDSTDLRRTRIGSILLSAALLDDVVGLILASVVPSITDSTDDSTSQHHAKKSIAESIARPVGVSIALFLIVIISPLRDALVRFLRNQVQKRISHKSRELQNGTQLFVIMLLLSGLVSGAYYAGGSMLLGAWVAGCLLGSADQHESKTVSDKQPRNVEETTEAMGEEAKPQNFLTTFEVLVGPVQSHIFSPLFFASIGSALPFLDLWSGKVIWRGLVYSIVMTAAKMAVGLWIVWWPASASENTPGTNARPVYPALFLAVAMVSRGEISLLIAQLGGLTGEAYLVVMWAIVLCTILGPLSTGLLLRFRRAQCIAPPWG